MSDSSEDEDLSRFREAVDTSFSRLIEESRGNTQNGTTEKASKRQKSERYLEEASHYNDVKVPEELQKRIGNKISAIIENNIEFVDMEPNGIKKRKIKGGVKLFKGSEGFLSWEEEKDTYTEVHNSKSKKLSKKRRQIDPDDIVLDENEKNNAVAVSGEYVSSKEEIKCWKSRRKEKLFKYKSKGTSNVLFAVE